MDTSFALRNMVEQQIRTWEVLDESVLRLYDKPALRRERFVADANCRPLAYADLQLPIGHGQSMLEPKLEARFLQALAPRPRDNFLHIGGGSGFFAALLAELCAKVTSLEIVPELAAAAQQRFFGHSKVEVVCADGITGYPPNALYDGIVLTGSVTRVPPDLFTQLKDRGRLLAVVGTPPVMTCKLYEKNIGGALVEDILETCIPPLSDKTLTREFEF